MKTTANYGLKKPEGTDVVNIEDLNYNADIIDTQIKSLNDKKIDYGTASGTNTYTVTIPGATLTEGRSYKIKFTNANTGAATLNINGLGAKSIVKSNGNALSSGNIKAGQILHLVYTGSVFQLLGEGGEYGTATADKVLTGYTIGTENGIVSGTMKDYSGTTLPRNSSGNITEVGYFKYNPELKDYYGAITFKTTNDGKIDSNTVFQQVVYGVNPEVVKAGQRIGSYESTVVGTFTADATATASQILSGKTAYVNGSKVTGTMPNNGAKIITPSTTNQAIPEGYHNGSGYVKGDANLKPENIKNGVSIFGVLGSLIEGKRWASGTFSETYSDINIRGLSFTPSKVLVYGYYTNAWNDRCHVVCVLSSTTDLYNGSAAATSVEAYKNTDDNSAYYRAAYDGSGIISNGFNLIISDYVKYPTLKWLAIE